MHDKENLTQFADGLNETELTIGHNITLIYEACTICLFHSQWPHILLFQAIRDGQLQQVCARLLAEL